MFSVVLCKRPLTAIHMPTSIPSVTCSKFSHFHEPTRYQAGEKFGILISTALPALISFHGIVNCGRSPQVQHVAGSTSPAEPAPGGIQLRLREGRDTIGRFRRILR